MWRGTLGIAELSLFGLHAHGDGVVATVVAALHLNDFGAAGDGTGQTQRECIVTSDPLLPKRTISTGNRSQMISASSSSKP